jgi:RimJ/RimL family protein N-acetyltransferase
MMDVSAGMEVDIPVIMALERLDGYERFVGRWEHDQHAAEIKNPASRYLVARANDEIVAFAILQGLATPNRSIRLKRIIARNPERGIGSRFLRSVLDVCFKELAAHRVDLFVHLHNERARRVYATIGFAEEGILRDIHRNEDGSFRSMRLMSILETEWANHAA